MASTIETSPDKLVSTLTTGSWATGPLFFIADVGGTNARLGFGHRTSSGGVEILYARYLMSKKEMEQLVEFFADLVKKLEALPDAGRSVLSRISSGAVSVPGPVMQSAVAGPFNNLKGMARLADYPTQLFPRGRSAILNDLEAGGYGVLALSDAGVLRDFFTVMWKGTAWDMQTKGQTAGHTLGKGRCFVAAQGTGLGTSLIHYDGVSDNYLVLALECGSATAGWAPLENKKSAYLSALSKKITKAAPAAVQETGVLAPNWEQITASGALQFNYAYENPSEAAQGKEKSAKEVAELAKSESDPAASKALDQLYLNTMDCLGEHTMSFLPLTVVLMGDNVVANSFYFEQEGCLARLQKRLYQHPMERQLKFLSRTTYLRQVKSVNVNMLGCYGFGTHLSASPEGGSHASKL